MHAGSTSADRPDSTPPCVGVLAMQGAFAEHVAALREFDVAAIEVRTVDELDRVDAIVLPGGESTAIRKALDRCGLLVPLRARIAAGLPAFGTCAGMIVLADTEPDGAPPCFGLLDVDVVRNGWGRQVHSTESAVTFADGTRAGAVFIRAPRITRIGAGVEVVARLVGDDEPVAVRQGHVLAAAYHPELTADRTLHRMLVELAREHAGVVA